MMALGWELGAGGNVAEEARIRSDKVNFMDYVGLKDVTAVPVVIIESKPWGKPFITARSVDGVDHEAELIIAAIEHIKAGKSRDTSPVSLAWYDYIYQIHGYVRNLKAQHDHEVERAVLASGDWIVVFLRPSVTFLSQNRLSPEDFLVFKYETLEADASRLFDCLSHLRLIGHEPQTLRPSQLGSFLDRHDLRGTFFGLHISYERSGSPVYEANPRILVYPEIIFIRNNGTFVVVISPESLVLDYDVNGGLESHLADVDNLARSLLQKCSQIIGVENIEVSDINDFPGFHTGKYDNAMGAGRRLVSTNFERADVFSIATGSATHFLRAQPGVGCRFHEWNECQDAGEAIGRSAVSMRSVKDPRSFFTDETLHHCAHQRLDDLRADRCHIRPLDQRICCRACIFWQTCWPDGEQSNLPCGT